MFAGVGLSALLGAPYVGRPIAGLTELAVPGLASLPVLGPALFAHDALVYAAVPIALAARWALFSTRWGLALRAVGENPVAAFAAGRNPRALQYQALLLAGALGRHRRRRPVDRRGPDVGGVDDRRAGLHRGRAGDLRPLAAAARDRRRLPVRRRDLASARAADPRRARLAVRARHAAVRAEPRRPRRVGRHRAPCRAREPRPRVPGITSDVEPRRGMP